MKMNLRTSITLCLGTLAVMCAFPMMNADAKGASEIVINKKNFPDTAFRNYVLNFCDIDHNQKLDRLEIKKVTRLNLLTREDDGEEIFEYAGVKNFTGIEYFTNLLELHCAPNISRLNLSGNKKLVRIVISDEYNTIGDVKYKLEYLDVSQNKKLKELTCEGSGLKIIKLPNGNALEQLGLMSNQLKNLDVSPCKGLKTLDCSGNSLMTLDLSHNQNLRKLDCQFNRIKVLDLSKNPVLRNCKVDDGTKLKGMKHKPVEKAKILRLYYVAPDKLKVSIKKVKNAAGYEILYSENKNLKNAKAVTSKKRSVVLKNIWSDKFCHVKVRAYTVNAKGKKIYGKYSGTSSIIRRSAK